MNQTKSVTIVVVGDAGVGKTSLISTLVSGIFPSSVPSVLQQVLLAPEETADNVQGVLIVDTSSEASEREHLFMHVLPLADVVLVVFDLNQPETLENVSETWLGPISSFSQTSNRAPSVVLVGNKTDLCPSTPHTEREAKRVLERYPNVDSCFLDCSAKSNIHVSDVFYFAQRSVLFPIPPLLDVGKNIFTPEFECALTRIFRVYDVDHDDMWSDVELNTFQEENFGCRLPKDDLDAIKLVLGEGDMVSFAGVTKLFHLFIKRNRAETIWKVLTRFGYLDKENLSQFTSRTKLKPNSRVELTKRGFSFLRNVFHQFAVEGVLTRADLNRIFVRDTFWQQELGGNHRRVLTVGEEGLPLGGWLSFWVLLFYETPLVGVAKLELLGYPELNLLQSALTYLKPKTGRESKLTQSVLRAACFGTNASLFVNGLIRRGGGDDSSSAMVCGLVKSLDPASGNNNNSNSSNTSLFLIASTESSLSIPHSQWDLCVFVVNGTIESVETIRSIQATIPSTVPCVYVFNSNKEEEKDNADDDTAEDAKVHAWQEARQLCLAYSLPEPMVMPLLFEDGQQHHDLGGEEAWHVQMDKMYSVFAQTALFPNCARPMSAEALAKQKQERILRAMGRITLVCTLVGTVSWVAWKLIGTRHRQQHSASSERT